MPSDGCVQRMVIVGASAPPREHARAATTVTIGLPHWNRTDARTD